MIATWVPLLKFIKMIVTRSRSSFNKTLISTYRPQAPLKRKVIAKKKYKDFTAQYQLPGPTSYDPLSYPIF